MINQDKVLVIGDDTRSFLSTVRGLGRQGIEVHVAPYDFSSPALKSKYIRQIHRLPYYLDGGADWLAAITELLQKENFTLVIPCEERSLLPLYVHREQLAPLATLAIPNEAELAAFFDKAETRAIATKLDVPIAPGCVIDDAIANPAALIHQLGLPLVIKPRHSYTWPDLYIRSSALLVDSASSLETWWADHPADRQQFLAEQVFQGDGIGVSVLCDKGEVLQAFEHRRVHEEFGSSFYRKSASLSPARLLAVEAMAASVSYTGLAMFEFKENPLNGEWILLEVNARPWGSMPLPLSLGINFPYGLYKLLVKHERLAAVPYASEMFGRNTIADIWQIKAAVARHGYTSAAGIKALGSWLWSFRRILLGRENSDLWVADDSAPARAEYGLFLKQRIEAIAKRLLGSDSKRLEALPTTERIRSVLFVCQGNICRSPYAEHKLKALLGNTPGITVKSSGMLPRNTRPSPDVAIAAAASLGVELKEHGSTVTTAALLDNADVVVIFDDINYQSLLKRFPQQEGKVVYLGAFAKTGKKKEVLDPEGSSFASFVTTYQQIDECLNGLQHSLTTKQNTHSQDAH